MNTQPRFLATAWRTTLALALSGLVVSVGYSKDADRDKDGAHHFWKKTAMSGHKEVALSELAATRAANAQVRSFAQQLVTDHKAMNDDLVAMRTDTRMNRSSTTANVTVPSSTSTTATTVGPAPAGSDVAATQNATEVDRLSSQVDRNPNRYSSTAGNPQAGDTAMRLNHPVTDEVKVDAPATRDNTAKTGVYGATGTSSASGSAAVNSTTTVDTTTAHDGSGPADFMRDHAYRKLSDKTGADFDKTYLKMMIDEHQEAIRLFEKTSKDNSDTTAQAFANKYLPKLREHLSQAEQLQKTVG